MSQLNIADRDDVVMVTFTNFKILDESVIRNIGAEFDKLTTEAAAERKLLLNFDRVTFMSSAMIGQIMKLYKKAKADGIALKLCCIDPTIMEVFKITRLDKLLDIRKTEADAIAAFGPPRKSWLGK
ncbi:MAG TPA: STAS domain-containing protein [Pirellulales bacterium]|jgi:anti-sigma B factor antagonist|nr:STAS domain-containing protein [Pirellulales bacterium]